MDYSSEVLRRFHLAQPAGDVPDGPGTAVGEAEDRTLNVWVRFGLEAVESTIVTAGFEAYGCPHTIAAASWIADWLQGRSLEAARQLDIHRVARELEVPVTKLGKLLRIEDSVLLCLDALGASPKEGR